MFRLRASSAPAPSVLSEVHWRADPWGSNPLFTPECPVRLSKFPQNDKIPDGWWLQKWLERTPGLKEGTDNGEPGFWPLYEKAVLKFLADMKKEAEVRCG